MPELDLDRLILDRGRHGVPEGDPHDKALCMVEAAAYIAGEGVGDHPDCVSPVLAGVGRLLNDRLEGDHRQSLVPYVPRLIGTNDDRDPERRAMADTWLRRVWARNWLDAAGMRNFIGAEPLDAGGEVRVITVMQARRRKSWRNTRDGDWEAARVALVTHGVVDLGLVALMGSTEDLYLGLGEDAALITYADANIGPDDAPHPLIEGLRRSLIRLYGEMIDPPEEYLP